MSEPVPSEDMPDEYYAVIGSITITGTMLDDLVTHAIWVLLRMPPERGRLITNLVINTSRKIKLLAELARPMFKDDSIRQKFDGVHAKLASAQTNRSKIVHAKWIFRQADRTWHIAVLESDETLPLAEPMPLPRLKGYANEIVDANRALERFFLEIELKPEETGHHVWPPYVHGVKARPKK